MPTKRETNPPSATWSGTRSAAMAGLFYPAGPAALAGEVEQHLAGGRARLGGLDRWPRGRVRAVIAPHAGYAYSGSVAGSAFAAFDDVAMVERVVLIGPSHHVAFRGMALPPAAALAFPGGALPLDVDACEALLALPGVMVDDTPHAREHAIEVELPFAAAVFGDVGIVPLVVGDADNDMVARVLDSLWSHVTCFVISSDLSHFLAYAQAREADRVTAGLVESLDRAVRPEQACGAKAINGWHGVARARGLRAFRLDLRSSGDTAGGHDRVVGYGAWAYVEA